MGWPREWVVAEALGWSTRLVGAGWFRKQKVVDEGQPSSMCSMCMGMCMWWAGGGSCAVGLVLEL